MTARMSAKSVGVLPFDITEPVPSAPVAATCNLRPAPTMPASSLPAPPSVSPPELPRPSHKALARAIFLRSAYPDPDALERTVAACCHAIRHERPHGGRPWVDRQPDVILVGRLGPSTATSTG